MVVELGHLDLPEDPVLGAVLDGDGQVSSVVETAEFGGLNVSGSAGTGLGLERSGLLLWLEEGGVLASDTLALLEDVYRQQTKVC